jgi:hypothetical protein
MEPTMTKKKPQPEIDGPRRAVRTTYDRALINAAEKRAEALGVPLARLLDVAVREELVRQGVAVAPAEGSDAAIERMIREARPA